MKRSVIPTQAKNDAQFVKHIVSHYEKYGRHELVWRTKITPYRILVSEIMLQQTQVSRVLPKYQTWMKLYPTLFRLGEASFTDVLKLWQGLGYQRRAKALHEIARNVKALPKSYAELLKLKGIGPYTASAILAFAYDVFPDHLVETNIRTALIEAFHQGETNIHDGKLYDDLARLHKLASVQKLGARHFYYALMDYGAYLKSEKISHNIKSAHYSRQSPYIGSVRQLRAKILFAIAHKEKLPSDERAQSVLEKLIEEKYIVERKGGYAIVE